jgi:hypothetical protein
VGRPSLRTTAIGLSVLLVTSATIGSLALGMAESAQDEALRTPTPHPEQAGAGWSWIALLSLYVTLLLLGPTIAAWWMLWSRRDDQNRRR